MSISGSSDKRCITGTFVITLAGDFLPSQLIYGGKTTQSLPIFKFPGSFSLSVNPKHFINTEESIKIINETVLPYVDKQKRKIGQSWSSSTPYFGCLQGANDTGGNHFAP